MKGNKWIRVYKLSYIQPYRWIRKRLSEAARHHGLGGLKPPPPNKNIIEPNRDVARGEERSPNTRKIRKLIN